MIELLFSLVLPLTALIIGIYLVHRGFGRIFTKEVRITGTASSKDGMQSYITHEKCVYSKLVVEYYRGGHKPWEEIFTVERRPHFLLDGKTIDPIHADLRLSCSFASQGYVRHRKDLLRETVDFLENQVQGISSLSTIRGMLDLTQEVRENEFLEPSVYDSVIAVPGAKEKIAPYINRPIRVSEYVIKEGAKVTVILDPAAQTGKATNISGTLEFPFIITDNVDAAGSLMKEKAYLSFLTGFFLIGVSFFLLIWLFVKTFSCLLQPLESFCISP